MNPPDPKTYAVASLQELWALAADLAGHFRHQGGVVALHGELGAGKTALVQGLAAALGVAQPVTSPTFALVLEYPLPDGRRLVHMDLYRLQELEALEAIGFEEYLESNDVIAIEWAERAAGLLPAATLHVDIRLSETAPGTRLISLRPCSG
jgi:tRNA threonylcarbamoyladenosine biosynthesis protein TsaE